MPYHETYQSSSENGKIKPITSQKRQDESPEVPIFEDIDMDENLKTLNNNTDWPPKQNST